MELKVNEELVLVEIGVMRPPIENEIREYAGRLNELNASVI
jgi:hypothetical protein